MSVNKISSLVRDDVLRLRRYQCVALSATCLAYTPSAVIKVFSGLSLSVLFFFQLLLNLFESVVSNLFTFVSFFFTWNLNSISHAKQRR